MLKQHISLIIQDVPATSSVTEAFEEELHQLNHQKKHGYFDHSRRCVGGTSISKYMQTE